MLFQIRRLFLAGGLFFDDILFDTRVDRLSFGFGPSGLCRDNTFPPAVSSPPEPTGLDSTSRTSGSFASLSDRHYPDKMIDILSREQILFSIADEK